MAIYLRQICLVAEHLAPAIDELSGVLSLPVCHIDPEVGKFGLENTLLALGSQFIEVVAPKDHDQPLQSTAAGRYLQRRGGDGGYMVICQVGSKAEQAELRERARQNNVRIAYESDRDTWNIMQLHPADMRAAFLEVDWDQESDMEGNWQPAGGKDWQKLTSTDVIDAIMAVELQSDDPKATAEHWAQIVDAAVEERDDGFIVPLENVKLRFVTATDGRGPGLGGLDLRVADYARLEKQAQAKGVTINNNQLMICGTRFNLVT